MALHNLNRKATLRHKRASNAVGVGGSDSDFHSFQHREFTRQSLRKSASGSSLGFVTAVKSASISLGSFSVATTFRNLGHSSKHPKTDRSSRASNLGPRASEDSAYIAKAIANDVAVANRSIQRRRVLEEIISTEEGYVGDIKFLMNVYVTLLASIPTISPILRASISRNLSEIVELHDEILGDLHQVVPHSEYTQPDYLRSSPTLGKQGHHRWRSLGAVPEHSGDLSWVQRVPGMTAEAQVAADVAKVFDKRMHRFSAYEEYGAKYKMMVKDIASTYKTLPQWEGYQKGLEALAASVVSTNIQQGQPNKSLTVGDLLVKPIQRVCRYPLLFAEVLKQTPVCDCPESHMEIQKVVLRLREMTLEINTATEDPHMKATMEKAWLLQEKHLVRSSASSMMRKLSVASITSIFTKRFGNAASLQKLPGSPGVDNGNNKVYISHHSANSPVQQKGSKMEPRIAQTMTSINDLDLQFDSLFNEKMASLTTPPVADRRPISTMKRLAVLRVKNAL